MKITFENPQKDLILNPGRPSIMKPFMDELVKHPNKWALYPTKTTKHQGIVVLKATIKKYCAKNSIVVDFAITRENDNHKLYIKFISNTH